ncbi:ATP-binding protein [Agrobacterium tumefaciens]|uniref:sensor histidine kinase n=1 Tax=Agrobacterium tomkonis TaxID=1183410 RepID=UPI001CD92E2B
MATAFMRAGSLLKSTAIRLAVLYISLFFVAYLAANVVAYQMVLRFLDERLNSNVMERFREISVAFDTRGLSGATDMIRNHGPAIQGAETIYTLRGNSGEILAGNRRISGAPEGFSNLSPQDQHDSDNNYKLFRGALGNNDLIVGISYTDTNQLAGIVLVSFGWTTAIVLTIGLGGAGILAYRSRQRIAALSDTAYAIGHGELSKRLRISRRMDDIDVLASEVNVAISRLEASVLALTQVTTDIAHDLKTPIGRAFLILDDALEAENLADSKASIETALLELRSIADTFDALLRIAQIESRSRTASFKIFDLSILARDIFEIYESIAADSGDILSIKSDTEICSIVGDADLVSQLLTNLLANAMRHTPVGSRIEMSVRREASFIELTVSDDGPGIPVNEVPRVFDRFYRLEKSRTTFGSGLGLSMVKAIADLHQAHTSVADNSPGLKLTISFPAV